MEYRGIEFRVVRTIQKKGWAWSVKRNHSDRVGISRDREDAVRNAKKYIDYLLRLRAREQE